MTVRLFVTELRRCFARRLTKILVLLGLAGTLIAGLIMFFTAEPPSRDAEAKRRQRVEASVGECVAFSTDKGRGFAGQPERAEAECRRQVGTGSDKKAHFTELWSEGRSGEYNLGFPIVVLVLAGLFGGASITGAEWRYNTFPFLLTWAPQRAKVVIAKILAPAVVAFVIGIFLLLVFTVAAVPASIWRGDFVGADSGWWSNYAVVLLRAGLLTSIGAAIGAAIATIGRNTTAAVGAAAVYLAIVETFLPLWKPQWSNWMVNRNGATFLLGYEADTMAPGVNTPTRALLVLLFYTLILTAIAAIWTRVRDVN